MYCSFIVSRVQCIPLRSTQSPIYQSLMLEGTLCLISTPGCDAWFYLVCTLPSRVPSWFPLVPSDWGIWVSPLETDQESCPGWLPSVPLDLVSSQEGFSPGPLTPRFEHFPATSILATSFLCVVYSVESLGETIHRLEDFINDLPSP